MHIFYTSSYDASVYLQQPEQNTGLDEILEIGKLYYGSSKDIARTFIKFETSSISTLVAQITGSWYAHLNLKSANSSEIPLQYTIQANPAYGSWSMGTGTKFDNITSNGISWYYKDGINKGTNIPGVLLYSDYPNQTQGSLLNQTGSISSGGGGFWYTGSTASQSFNYEPDDVRIDVTNIVKMWLSGSIPNNGFVLHHTLDAENDGLDYGILKFFSKETSTIYEPKLELSYSDSIINTGSLTPVTGSAEDGYKVVLTNLKTEYPQNGIITIRVKGRDTFPMKSFGTTFAYDQNKYLPTASYYQLEDYVTGEIIFPFGAHTQLSCDSTSNYFKLNLSTLPFGREYKLKLKIVDTDGSVTIIDNKSIFEIV
jgi:hypothetical protein